MGWQLGTFCFCRIMPLWDRFSSAWFPAPWPSLPLPLNNDYYLLCPCQRPRIQTQEEGGARHMYSGGSGYSMVEATPPWANSTPALVISHRIGTPVQYLLIAPFPCFFDLGYWGLFFPLYIGPVPTLKAKTSLPQLPHPNCRF